jgi:ribose transport system substrate-binding protein
MASIDGDKVGFQMLFEDGSPFVATVAQEVPRIGEIAGIDIIKAISGQAKSIPQFEFTNFFVATRNNGVKAAELRWGANIWADIKIDKAAVAAKYPQNQDLILATSTVP